MKKDYMAKLERAARWRLPPQEAKEVVSDYLDMFGTPPRSEEELYREVGDPEQVVKLLVSPPRAYRIWLAVFFAMSACILLLGISPTMLGYPFWRLFFDGWAEHPIGPVIAVLGAVTALVWFHRQGQKGERLSKAIPILLAVCLAFIGAVMWFCWACARDFDGFLSMWGTVKTWIGPNTSQAASFYLLRVAMCYGCTVVAIVGEVGLVKARTGDRRWAAVYVLALAAMLTALLVLYWTGRMDVTASVATPEGEFRQMLLWCSCVAAVGLVGTGVALC